MYSIFYIRKYSILFGIRSDRISNTSIRYFQYSIFDVFFIRSERIILNSKTLIPTHRPCFPTIRSTPIRFTLPQDCVIVMLMILAGSLALPANILAFKYFWSDKRRDIANTMYIAIAVIDVCISITYLPVAVSLLNGRDPMWFNSAAFCAFWSVFFGYHLEISMFLVMLLSVSRTLVIVFPFMVVSKNKVLGAFLIYTAFNIAADFVGYHHGMTYVYGSDTAYCYEIEPSSTSLTTGAKLILKISNIKTTVQLGIPPIVIFISFVISTVKLMRPVRVFSGMQRNVSRRATKTVAMFTGIFLMCNLPYFVCYMLETITVVAFSYPEPFFSGTFMFYYSWVIAKPFMIVLNAVCNPVLYFCRMPRFRLWILELKNRVKSRARKISALKPVKEGTPC